VSPTIRRRVYVGGRVQGVWFRESARRRAEQLGVAGTARNLNDGRVELDVEGPSDAVEALIAWARRGPSRARVDTLVVEEHEPTGRTNFYTDW
jgi:acylphosphatase